MKALQDIHAPDSICFGCGVKNERGLQIKSRWVDSEFVMYFTPRENHQAFDGFINGGILGTLLDCHSNWCAASTLYKKDADDHFPSTVTSEFHVKLKRPTPFGVELKVTAKPTVVARDKVSIYAEITAAGKVTTTCNAIFIRVKSGHPAFHRWN